MSTSQGRTAPWAVVAIALMGFFAACSGGSDGESAAGAPTEPSVSPPVAPVAQQPGVLRTVADWAGAPVATFYRPVTALKTADRSLWIGGAWLRRLGPDGMVRGGKVEGRRSP